MPLPGSSHDLLSAYKDPLSGSEVWVETEASPNRAGEPASAINPAHDGFLALMEVFVHRIVRIRVFELSAVREFDCKGMVFCLGASAYR